MIKKSVQLIEYQLNKALEHDIKSKLFYISDQIVDFEIILGDHYIEKINFMLQKDIDIAKKLDCLIKNDIQNIPIIKDKILWESIKRTNTYFKLYQEMINQKIIYECGYGRIAIGEPLISLIEYLDGKLKYFYITELGAQEYVYPTLIDIDTIKKCGYLNNSPNMIFFIQHLHNDIGDYMDFKREYSNHNRIDKNFLGELKYCLPPTMCYHTYKQLEGTTIDNTVYTSKGKSFRYENKYASTLERLWDFTIRETIFFGSYSFVTDVKNKILGFAQKMVNELKLIGFCSNANDLFFFDEQAAYKTKYQKALNSKIELRLNINDEKSIAIASFNFHDSFFCDNFNIKNDNTSEFVSGCTGFGLERFAYAFICQHGLDQTKWPIKIT